MPPQRLNQTPLSEFLFGIVKGFSDPVGVERERIPRKEQRFRYRAIPFFEEPQYRAGGMKPFNRAIVPEKKGAKMAAIGVAQTPHVVVIFGKEEGCVSAVGRILVKELVH